jgi:hypothetical protein
MHCGANCSQFAQLRPQSNAICSAEPVDADFSVLENALPEQPNEAASAKTRLDADRASIYGYNTIG